MISVFPDIGVFGPYTYLVTELFWGAIALALVWYGGVVRRTARTVLVLYPFAYAWDWYTLQVGVFAIPLRTGVELLGIPIEEHIFMLVVPALVVGLHETLGSLDGIGSAPLPASVRDDDPGEDHTDEQPHNNDERGFW